VIPLIIPGRVCLLAACRRSPEKAYAKPPNTRCHDIVITGSRERDTARRFATQRVTRSAPSRRAISRSTGGRSTIVAIIQAYATLVPAELNTLNAICNYATIADAPTAIFERISCCVGRGVTQ
jgi:hypothetical protein